MSWLQSLAPKRSQAPAAAPAPQPPPTDAADDFLSDSLLPPEQAQDRKRRKSALAAAAAEAARVPLAVLMQESVATGMQRALDRSNKGFEMLEKMGWSREDPALGSSVRGAAEPISVAIKRTREGLGCPTEPPPVPSSSRAVISESSLMDFRLITRPCAIYVCNRSRRCAKAGLAHTLSCISTARVKIVELDEQLNAQPKIASSTLSDTVEPSSLSSAGDDDYDPDIKDSPPHDACHAPNLPPPHRIHLVDDPNSAAKAMIALEDHDVFAVDLEGVELGRGGTISILQVAVQAADGAFDVYIFDILELGQEAFTCGLGAMLGSSRAFKLMFDVRSDADALWHCWRVSLKGVFDVQVAHVLAFSCNCRHLPSLLSVIENSNGVSEIERSRARAAKTGGPTIGPDGCYNSRVWLNRPLNSNLLKYAAGDVAVLFPLYRYTSNALQLQLQSDSEVMDISQMRIVACTSSITGRPRSSDRDFFERIAEDAEGACQLQRRLITLLRERYRYCLWCKSTYKDQEEMMALCPGPNEDDH